MRFEYSQSGDGTWSWHLKSSMGELVAQGGAYSSRELCLASIKLVKLAASAGCREISPSARHATPSSERHAVLETV